MKKTISLLLAFLIVASLTACNNNPTQTEPTTTPEDEVVVWESITQDEIVEKFGKTFNLNKIEDVVYRYNVEVDMAEASYYVEIENPADDTIEDETTPETVPDETVNNDTSESTETTDESTESTEESDKSVESEDVEEKDASYQVVVRMKKLNEWYNILVDAGISMDEATENNISETIKGKIASGETEDYTYVAGIWFDEELQIVYAMIIYNENGDLSVAKDIFVPDAT